MTFLTIFTTPKPFTQPHIATIQRNALKSWLQLGTDVEVLVIGDEPGLAEVAHEYGIHHIPEIERNSSGTPLVSSIFDQARTHAHGQVLAYVNADILLMPDFVEAARNVARHVDDFLIVGQRWDLDVTQDLEIKSGWRDRLEEELKMNGRLHPRTGSDYFVFPREAYEDMPAFAVGRAGWDNWMIYQARKEGWAVVDATASVRIIHQNHDYSHLPNGQPHYRLPETSENVRLAGGRRVIFKLDDVNLCLVDGALTAPAQSWVKFWREVEIMPLVNFQSMALAQVFFAIFHPGRAYREFRAWLREKRTGNSGDGNADLA